MKTVSTLPAGDGSGPMTPARGRTALPRTGAKAAIAAAVLACLAVVGFSFSRSDPAEVRVTTPAYGEVEQTVTTMGKVIPVDEFEARASFAGMVEKVFVHVGQTVHPGQKLVAMKDPFAAARVLSATAALESARVSNENVHQGGSQEDLIGLRGERKNAVQEQAAAQEALLSIQQLQKTGAASAAEVSRSEQRLQTANAAVETARQKMTTRYSASDQASWVTRVAQAKASLDAERVSFKNANIASPIDGSVILTPVSANDYVGTGASLVQVADLKRVKIRAFFDEPDMGKLHVGQVVTIRWEGKPDQRWTGRLERVPLSTVAMGTRTVGEYLISVDNEKGELLANTNVTVSVTVAKKTNVLTLPREALHLDAGADYIFCVEDGRLVRKPVSVGLVNLTLWEVTGGLTLHDTIALHTSAGGELKDGTKVGVLR